MDMEKAPAGAAKPSSQFGVSDADLALMLEKSRGQDWLTHSERVGFNLTDQPPLPPDQPLHTKLVPLEQVLQAKFSGCGPKFFVVEEQRRDRRNGAVVPCATVGQLYIEDSTEHAHQQTSELYFVRGTGMGSKMVVGDQYIDLDAGTVVLLPPGVKHGGCGELDAVMLFSPGLAKRGHWDQRDERLTGRRANEAIGDLRWRPVHRDPQNTAADVTHGGAIVAQIPPQFLGEPSTTPPADETPFGRSIPGISVMALTVRGDSPSVVHDRPGETKIYLILGGSGYLLLGDKVEHVERDSVVVVPPSVRNALFTEEGGAVNALVAFLSEDREAGRAYLERVVSGETRSNVQHLLTTSP